jgi:triosephosphate isomerase
MRKKLVVGNWKMNLTTAEARACVEAFVEHVDWDVAVDVGICPPFLSIPTVRPLLEKTHVWLGAQDVFWIEKGAFTGCVSASMLSDAGVRLCIVGHSETRGRFGKLEVPETTLAYFGETDQTVNLKIRALLQRGIMPILCVGENLEEREAGLTDSTIQAQVKAGLVGIDSAEFREGVVAYEPVWAIGTGKTCEAVEANRVCGMIRDTLAEVFDRDTAMSIRVLYGGSVKGANAHELFHQPQIDGGLVGGSSLIPDEFSRIVHAAN